MYTVKEEKDSVINTLQTSSLLLFKWFNNNIMKDNNDKKDLLLRCIEPSAIVIDCFPIESNIKEMLPGITTDSK